MSTRRPVTIAAAIALLLGAALMAAPMAVDDDPEPPPAAEGLTLQPTRYVSAWLPYWKVDSGLSSFTGNADLFTDLTTFFHYVTGPDAALSNRAQPGQVEATMQAARDRGIVVLAAVLDDTPSGTMRQILLDPARRAAHIAALLPLVDEVGYDGIDIDYENFAFADGSATWPSTRNGWVAFITELRAALSARGKYLTVAVPPQFNTANDGSSGYWVYDWPAIAPHIDVLRVMTYDYSGSDPGPIAPIGWVERATEFGMAALGPEKFRIGVPTYGRDWVLSQSGAGCPAANLSRFVSRTSEELLQIASANGVEVGFDPTDQEAAFSYQQSLPDCTAGRQAHFADARTVAARADLALANGTGIALWSLGGEDPATWEALRRAAAERAAAERASGG